MLATSDLTALATEGLARVAAGVFDWPFFDTKLRAVLENLAVEDRAAWVSANADTQSSAILLQEKRFPDFVAQLVATPTRRFDVLAACDATDRLTYYLVEAANTATAKSAPASDFVNHYLSLDDSWSRLALRAAKLSLMATCPDLQMQTVSVGGSPISAVATVELSPLEWQRLGKFQSQCLSVISRVFRDAYRLAMPRASLRPTLDVLVLEAAGRHIRQGGDVAWFTNVTPDPRARNARVMASQSIPVFD